MAFIATLCAVLTPSTQASKLIPTKFTNAVVYRDHNSNGILDAGEPNTTTNADGAFVVSPLKGKGRIYLSGGIEIATGKPNTLLLVLPKHAKSLTTLSSLFQALIDRGASPKKAGKLLHFPRKATIADHTTVRQDYAHPGSKKGTLVKRDAQYDVLVKFSKSLSYARIGTLRPVPGSDRGMATQVGTIGGRTNGLAQSGIVEDPAIGALADALLAEAKYVLSLVDKEDIKKIYTIVTSTLQAPLFDSELNPISQTTAELNLQIEAGTTPMDKLSQIRASAESVIEAGDYTTLSNEFTGDGLARQVNGSVFQGSAYVRASDAALQAIFSILRDD